MYYLNSRYYNPDWGRFINADGLVSTGQDLLGFNMFAYCCDNPIMFSDPSGTFSKLFDFTNKVVNFVDTMCSITQGNTGAALGFMADFLGGVLDVALEFTKGIIENSERPSNIGLGVYNKYISAQISSITKAQSHISGAFSVLSYAFIALDIGESAYSEYQMGYSAGKILWDSAVELGFSILGVGVSTQAGILASAFVASVFAVSNPVVLAATVAVGGITAGIIYDVASDNRKRQMKGFVT